MANATPHSTAGNQDPAAIPKSAQARHFVSSILPRHSIDTTRRIMPNRIASSGRYSVENTVAYQPGNAANIAAPAMISQTSLPSQTGPMVFSAARRWVSGSPDADVSERLHQHADAEVEALQDEETEEQHRDDAEPQLLQSHRSAPFRVSRPQYANESGATSSSPGAGGGAGSASCSCGPSTM